MFLSWYWYIFSDYTNKTFPSLSSVGKFSLKFTTGFNFLNCNNSLSLSKNFVWLSDFNWTAWKLNISIYSRKKFQWKLKRHQKLISENLPSTPDIKLLSPWWSKNGSFLCSGQTFTIQDLPDFVFDIKLKYVIQGHKGYMNP